MKTTVLLALLLIALSAVAQQPSVTAQGNTIYVSADGKYESVPDTALLQFNISAQEDTPKAAYDHASRAADQVRETLRANGTDPKSAEIGFFALQPVYDWRQPKRKLVGYRVNSSVSLKLKDFSKVAGIVQQLSDADVADNQSLSYTLDNIDAAKIKASQDAFQRARAEAQAIASAAGRTLGELSYASVDTYEQVRILAQPMVSRAAPMAAQSAPQGPTAEFSPQKVVVTARVSAMFTLK